MAVTNRLKCSNNSNNVYMKFKSVYLVLLTLIITGCVSTKTIYRVETFPVIKTIGVIYVENSEDYKKVFPKFEETYNSEMKKVLTEYGFSVIQIKNDSLSYSTPKSDIVKRICKENNLDALLIPRFGLTQINEYFYFLKTGKNFETELELQLLDKDANLLILVKYDSTKDHGANRVGLKKLKEV